MDRLQSVILLHILIILLYLPVSPAAVQSIFVTGKLLCDGLPATDIRVKLYEGEMFFDTLLDESVTDKNGEFRVYGTKEEMTMIEPKVNIYHKCNYNGPCVKKFSVSIPKSSVTIGEKPVHNFNIGTLNLANEYHDWILASIDCINK